MIRTSFPSTLPRHRVADLGLVALLGGADVVFHLQAREVVEPEEVTDTSPREPAASRQRDDHVRLEVGALHRVGDVAAEPVDVLPVGEGAVEVVREIAHTAVPPTRALIRV